MYGMTNLASTVIVISLIGYGNCEANRAAFQYWLGSRTNKKKVSFSRNDLLVKRNRRPTAIDRINEPEWASIDVHTAQEWSRNDHSR